MILVDSSVWIDFLRGADSRERRTLHRLIDAEEDIAVAEIVLTEVLQGIKAERDFQAVKARLLEFPVSRPTGAETYVTAAQIFRECRSNGTPVRKTIDCLIAAICIENGLTLLHRDSDFDLIAACTALKVVKQR